MPPPPRRFRTTDPSARKAGNRAAPRPPAARRTPSSPPPGAPPLFAPKGDAPGWARRAYRLALALHQALREERIDDSTRCAIERSFAAFELGYGDKQIATVAHLVESAYTAIRETQRRELERAYRDCAGVLEKTLYPVLRRHVPFDELVDTVRRLRMEANAQLAITAGVCELLGWDDAARQHAGVAIRTAMARARAAAEED